MTGDVRVPPGEQPAGGGVQVDEGGADRGSAGAGGVSESQERSGELEALQNQLNERTGDLQRISAEYSNYRRRVERDRQAVIAGAKAQVAGELLTVLDDIERAAAHGDLSGAFKVVADKLVAGLQAHGLEQFGAEGDTFDPEVHEAVQHSTSPDVEGPTVTTVLRSGYRFGDRVLRPAMVAVTDAEVADATAAPGAAAAADPDAASRDAARFTGTGTSSDGAAGSAAPSDGADRAQED